MRRRTNENLVLKDFVESFAKYKIDILVIAGDISDNYLKTIDFINKLNINLPYRIYYVPGNHDMWSKGIDVSTSEIYQAYKEDMNCLVGQSIYLENDTYLIGDIFWYDYSFADQSFEIDKLVKKTHGKRIWKDSIYIDWQYTDIEISKRMIDKVKAIVSIY